MDAREQSGDGKTSAHTELSRLVYALRYSLADIKDLHRVATEKLEEKKHEARTIGKDVAQLSDPVQRVVARLWSETGEQDYGYILPNVLRGSLLMTTCGVFDRYLGRVCLICAEIGLARQSCKVSESKFEKALKGGIWKKMEFLSVLWGVTLPRCNKLPLRLITHIRNSFAHASGLVDDNEAGTLRELYAQLEADDLGDRRLRGFVLYEAGSSMFGIELDQFFMYGVYDEVCKVFAALICDVEIKLPDNAT